MFDSSNKRSILRGAGSAAMRHAVDLGLPAAWVGYRHIRAETPMEHIRRTGLAGSSNDSLDLVHAEAVADNPLPFNVADRQSLPADRGWWGYSMHDVPARRSDPTYRATIRNAQVITARDGDGQFFPAVLTGDGRAINMREIVFRPVHAQILRSEPPVRRLERATWLCERSFDNHSHWLTAHLPKLVLLQARGELADVLLPDELPETARTSLAMLGLDPGAFKTFTTGEVLQIDRLDLWSTDRFRGELLRPVRDALVPERGQPATRRIYISRAKAGIRRLANEDAIWPMFAEAGFERVFMEKLDFETQLQLMAETAALAAPHGAGLTNMIFCPPGTHVLEIAWLGFPNPNFYALACAMNLRYGLVAAQQVESDLHPLQRDMTVEPSAIREALAQMEASMARTPNMRDSAHT